MPCMSHQKLTCFVFDKARASITHDRRCTTTSTACCCWRVKEYTVWGTYGTQCRSVRSQNRPPAPSARVMIWAHNQAVEALTLV